MSVATAKTLKSNQAVVVNLPQKIFNHEPGEFNHNFNRLPFAISHNLANHPLFGISRMAELAKFLFAMGGGKVLFQEGQTTFDERWEDIPKKTASFIDGLKHIQDSDSWMLLKSIQEDPEYKALLDGCVAELSTLTGIDLVKKGSWIEGYIFIASPESVTPHHMDHESTFLLQIHGEKKFNICDPYDRTVLFEEEIEKYYLGDLSAARFKDISQEKAYVFPFAPGTGAHIPSKGPHWVRNGKDYSVTFNINICMEEMELRARVYQVNHYLRKLNFQPTPPGKSAFKDRLKVMIAGGSQSKAPTKYDMLRQNLKRLDQRFNRIGKLLRRPVNS